VPRPIAEAFRGSSAFPLWRFVRWREALRSGSRPVRCLDLVETFGPRPGRRWRVELEAGTGSALLGLPLVWRLDRATVFALCFEFLDDLAAAFDVTVASVVTRRAVVFLRLPSFFVVIWLPIVDRSFPLESRCCFAAVSEEPWFLGERRGFVVVLVLGSS